MTEQLFQRLVEDGYDLVRLEQLNPVLRPFALEELWTEWGKMIPHRKGFGLWSDLDGMMRMSAQWLQCDKVLFLLSGVATGGKDAIRKQIDEKFPGRMRKLVSATTRGIRPGEEHGKDYYFYDREAFKHQIESGAMLEWGEQGDRLYGLPVESIESALLRPEPVMVTHVEMESGWPGIDRWLQDYRGDLRIGVLKVFVMPEMPFHDFEKRVWRERATDDPKNRIYKSVRELALAPRTADVVVTNRIMEGTLQPLEWVAADLFGSANLMLQDKYRIAVQGSKLDPSQGIPDKMIPAYQEAQVN
ncbi:hypothetical protein A2W24_06585 [Microgenomates group bacterium RBG_16_45_19]|nr:MAG: hypothetical protein A2W24_06585 [Microgenomates group bacterium RBG_16_45_19]